MQIQISGSGLGPKVDGEYVITEEKFNDEDQFQKSDNEGTWLFYSNGHWVVADVDAKNPSSQAGAGGLEEKYDATTLEKVYFRSESGAVIPNELSTEQWAHESDDHVLTISKRFAECIHVKAPGTCIACAL